MEPYSDDLLRGVLTSTKSIAVVGISANPLRASYFVGRYFSQRNFRIIPINPGLEGQELFGETVYASLSDIPPDLPVDMVDIFRRSDMAGKIVDDAIVHLKSNGLKTIWMQIGVINEEAARRAEVAGLSVIMNRCPKIEYQRLFGELRMAGFNTGMISSKLPNL